MGNKDEYVSKAEIIGRLRNICFTAERAWPAATMVAAIIEHLIDVIDNMPSADAREVKRGEWVGDFDGYADGEPVYDIWSCSACGYVFGEWDEKPTWEYCPRCGADMRPEEVDADA